MPGSMTKTFGAQSTTDEVLEGIDLSGKRILVTGVSAGLGVETARVLAAHGAQVVGAARNLDKARAATEIVRTQAANGGSLELVELDLASLKSVRACADALVSAGKPFDIVIANAGVMATPKGQTADGFETQFGTNHLGHFVLVNRIARLMKPGSRLVVLSSAGHRYADVDLDDPNFERTPYGGIVAYGTSQTLNVTLFSWLKGREGARLLWFRAGLSSVLSQIVDTLLFVSIAFWGVFPIGELLAGQMLAKVVLSAVLVPPLIYLLVGLGRRLDAA